MEKFRSIVQELIGLQLTREQVHLFSLYEAELLDWNARFNLTAIRDQEGIRIKHFLDSLTCLLAMDSRKPPESLVDIGTGAGFPGIPIKIVHPRLRLTLVESVHKKANFCQHIADQLKLDNVTILSERAEEVGQDTVHKQAYDIAVARAVASMPTLVEYLLPLVRLGGTVIMQKGESAHAEVHSAQKAIEILGGRLRKVIPVLLPGVVEERFLVVIDKVAITSDHYPRKTGLPAKQPLV